MLGFFGDETDYNGFIPWTPKLLEEFQKQKGYDLKPYIPLFFMGKLTEEAQRAKADYYDVWSGMFAKNFFDVLADWNAEEQHGRPQAYGRQQRADSHDSQRGRLFQDHAACEGAWYRQPESRSALALWPTSPKLASSAAHLFGRPKAWEEEGGGDGELGKFVADYHFARGVTALQLRGGGGFGGSSGPPR